MLTDVVLFDLDGTLTDTLPLIIQTYRQVFRDLVIPWGDDDVVKLIGLPLVDIAGHFMVRDRERFVELYQHYYKIDHDNLTRLFPGTIELMSRLKELGLKLGLVTSKGRPVTERTLKYTRLEGFMETVVTAHDVSNTKPHPAPVEKALIALGAVPERAIMVGDSSFDILTGKNAGTRTLGVSWGLDNRESLEMLKPDGVLDTWDDIYQHL